MGSLSSPPPPPKFPRSTLNPGPETPADWDTLVKWFLSQNRTISSQSQVTVTQLAALPIPAPAERLQNPPRYISLGFYFMTAGGQTANIPIPFPADTTPLALDISAVVAPASTPALFDLETSPDLVSWTSILTTPASLPVGQKKLATITTFAAGALIQPGQWIRSVIAGGSDLAAEQVAIVLTVP